MGSALIPRTRSSMTEPNRPLRELGFLHLGHFDVADPAPGHELALRLIVLAEQLGYDSAWVRQRHLESAISSPLLVIAAASQRTSRIRLGTAVIPLGPENPFRLAEDLQTLDLLTGGRLNPGFSVGTPLNYDSYKDKLYPDAAWEREDLSHARAERLLGFLRNERIATQERELNDFLAVPTLQPHSPGLLPRVWYGAGSLKSAQWGGRAGLNFLTSNVVSGEGTSSFPAAQAALIRRYREHHPAGEAARVSQGLVVIPTDNATPAQRKKYAAYAAERDRREGVPWGPRKTLFARDIVGTAEQVIDTLGNDEAFRLVDEVAFPLPFDFEYEDYAQILTDIATLVAPALGWQPARESVTS